MSRLRSIQLRLDVLADELIRFWKAHGPDREHGGFHGWNARTGSPLPDADKGLVQQARHLWTFSTWYERRESKPEVRALADGLYTFLTACFQDTDGEFVYRVSRDGKRVVNAQKQLYAESFAIFALSTYARVFGVDDARRRALACFRALDARLHDDELGGYDQRNDPGWLSPGAEKETNTHLHVLEALTALSRATEDSLVVSRLDELVQVMARRMVQPAGYTHKEFFRDFRLHGPPAVSYGHDLETSWLLFDALAALGTSDAELVASARRLGECSAEWGFDRDAGGYFEEGPPGAAATKLEKIWWVQAEAVPALWWLYRLSSDRTHLDRLERTLTWIETRQRDAEHGEWFWGILPDGSVGARGDQKGEEWKASYHGVRGMLFTSDWIAQALAERSESPRQR
ncbi:MAG: AGE family epimerase/isomerase [Polyangiaceae bacterium]